jgi:hypothetical protein
MAASGGLMRPMHTATHRPRSGSMSNVAMGAVPAQGLSTGIPVPRYGAVRADPPTTGQPDTAKRPRLMVGDAGAAAGGGGGGGGATADARLPQRPARQQRQPRVSRWGQEPPPPRWGVF